jgi:large subunit ribosomal protein L4
MIEAPHYSASGARHKSAFALPAELFDGTVHEPVLHQAIKTHLANQRQGTAKTKTRSFVSGGNQKPWRQKGTGRARQGSIRSPLWRGGGIVFGPEPRDYRTRLPRKVRQLARRSAFNARAREGALLVVEAMSFDAPKTSQLAGLLGKLGLTGKKVLVLSHGLNRNLYLSGRNLPSAEVMTFADASAYDLLWSDAVVVEQAALSGGELVEPGSSPAPERPKAAPRKKPTKAPAKAAAPKVKKPAAKKPPAKPAAKKSQIKPAAKKKKES